MNITESFKSLKHRVKHKYVNISYRIVKIIDGLRDIWYCGSLLARDQKVEVEGATAYSPTWYWALYEIFKDAEFTKDVLLTSAVERGEYCYGSSKMGFPDKSQVLRKILKWQQ